MTALRCLPLFALAACDPVWAADFHVTNVATGAPIPDTSIALVHCKDSDWTMATITDDTGVAEIAGLGFTLPDCDFVVATPGFQQHTGTFEAICLGDLHDCDRVRRIDVRLEANR